MSDVKKRVIGTVMSVFAGVCYALSSAPVTYLQQHFPCANLFAFSFSHFSGIFFSSTCILLVYSLVKRNRPFVERRSVAIGIAAGLLWGVSQ